MQTKPEAEVGAISGARQVPLLRRDQLVAGAIFTGIAADHVHEVVGDIEGDTLIIQRLPRVAQDANHTHSYTQFGNTTCACGLGRRPVAMFLPEDGTTPRGHLLIPIGPIAVPDTCSVYLFAGPRTLVVRDGADVAPSMGNEVPIILRATKIWSLPEAARRLIAAQRGASSL